MDSRQTQGKRVEVDPDGGLMGRGEYGFVEEVATWYAMTPNGLLANLSNHRVERHEDGTITVTPSIKVLAGWGREWHGFLTKGVWRELAQGPCMAEGRPGEQDAPQK